MTIRIGIAYDLKSDFSDDELSAAIDRLEEYDSEETVDRIASSLRTAGHEPVKLGGGRRFIEQVLSNSSPPRVLDMVFNIAEGRGGRSREAQVPAVCEMLGILYTHSDPLTLALSLDKPLAKRVAASYGVPTAPFVSVERLSELDASRLPPFPLIAKPAYEGSSMGIRTHSRCETFNQLKELTVSLLEQYSGPVIIEKFLTGVEVTVAIVGAGDQARVLGAMEISPRHSTVDSFVYSLEVKRRYLEEVTYHVPPRLPATTNAAIVQTALGAYRAIGCRDIGRVDVRLDADGIPCFIEINPLPGLAPVSGDIPIMCGQVGISYDTLIATIVSAAEARRSSAFDAGALR